jgi:hypothetical protein
MYDIADNVVIIELKVSNSNREALSREEQREENNVLSSSRWSFASSRLRGS